MLYEVEGKRIHNKNLIDHVFNSALLGNAQSNAQIQLILYSKDSADSWS